MNKLLTVIMLLLLVSCGISSPSCVKESMFIYEKADSTPTPTGVTAEQAMKICGIK